MCIEDERTPKWKRVAPGTRSTRLLAITVFGMKPIGMYLRFSEETEGIKRYLLSGCRISPNNAGVFASSRVVSRELASRCLRTALTRSITLGSARISAGDAPLSQTHQ